jgi:hypothetical protein
VGGVLGASREHSLAAFGYTTATGMTLLFNQFGLDRHGIKVLLLLPVSSRTLLEGKWLCFAMWQTFQAVLLSVLLFVTGTHDLPLLFTGFLVYACAFFGLTIVGRFFSVWQPHPLDPMTMARGKTPLIVVGAIGATVIAIATLISVTLTGVGFFAPGWEPAALIVLLSALAGIAWALLPFSAAFLNRHKERLVETLSSSA